MTPVSREKGSLVRQWLQILLPAVTAIAVLCGFARMHMQAVAATEARASITRYREEDLIREKEIECRVIRHSDESYQNIQKRLDAIQGQQTQILDVLLRR